jgi:hypothetical protein
MSVALAFIAVCVLLHRVSLNIVTQLKIVM